MTPAPDASGCAALWPAYFSAPAPAAGSRESRQPGPDASAALPQADVDLSVFARDIIPGDPAPTWAGRTRNLISHFRALEPEFAARPRLGHLLACTIVVLRRDPQQPQAQALFHRITAEHGADAAQGINLRWLASVCDTLMDIGTTPEDRALAMTGSVTANLVKLAETERRVFAPRIPWPPQASFRQGGPLFDGMISYWIGKGEMIDNLLNRIERVTTTDSPAAPFVIEVFNRLFENDTTLSRLYGLQGRNAPGRAPRDETGLIEQAIAALRPAPD
ncbi:hypothetical protein [Paracoccus jiaweipingae]|uniref:hypothetical protein n=1 Tax=unclassified Paracoccus (in: a-proteobacteria) TaxID=2688777 RepID=UPI00379C1360